MVGHRLPERRDRRLVAWAGVAPDLDGLTLLAGVEAYGRWHHVVMHGIVGAALSTACVAALARERVKTAGLALAAFHLHLLCDLFGSGVAWGIVYFWPFSDYEYFSPYRWDLASWQNVTVTVLALAACARIAIVRGRTFAEAFLPALADEGVVAALRHRLSPEADHPTRSEHVE
jgi:hypothetical protein